MDFVLQSAAPQQMNTAFVNSSVTDNIQKKMMTVPGALLFRGIRSWSERSVLYCYFPSFSFPLACDWCGFDIRLSTAAFFYGRKGFFEKQVLPTFSLTQDHLLQHLYMLAFDFIIPEEYSCLIISKNSFLRPLNRWLSFGYWTSLRLLPSEHTGARGRCYHAHHFFDTTSCWSLTISNILPRFLMKARSPFPSVTSVRLAEAW